MNTDTVKKKPVSRKSVIANQGLNHTNSSVFIPITAGAGFIDQSGHLHAGKVDVCVIHVRQLHAWFLLFLL